MERLGSLHTLYNVYSICAWTSPENEFCSSHPWSGCFSALCSSTPSAGCERQPWSLWLTGCGAQIKHRGSIKVQRKNIRQKKSYKLKPLYWNMFACAFYVAPCCFLTAMWPSWGQKHHWAKCLNESSSEASLGRSECSEESVTNSNPFIPMPAPLERLLHLQTATTASISWALASRGSPRLAA